MAETTKIEWADATFNPWRGCTKVSDGCKHCYAETLSARNPKVLGVWGPQGTRVLASDAMWKEPLKWNAEAKAAGVQRRVFCASLADVFEGANTCGGPDSENYRVVQEGRRRLFNLALETPNLTWLFLTKRPENIAPSLSEIEFGGSGVSLWELQREDPRPEWWFGTSVEDQVAADKRIPELLSVPAAVRFLSCEPLLGPVEIRQYLDHWRCRCGGIAMPLTDESGCNCGDIYDQDWWHAKGGIGWVIAGGESGPGARPMHPDWARGLRDQCEAADVPFLFKQWGEWGPSISENIIGKPSHRHVDAATKTTRTLYRVGKAAAGRQLDGQEWNGFPRTEAA